MAVEADDPGVLEPIVDGGAVFELVESAHGFSESHGAVFSDSWIPTPVTALVVFVTSDRETVSDIESEETFWRSGRWGRDG